MLLLVIFLTHLVFSFEFNFYPFSIFCSVFWLALLDLSLGFSLGFFLDFSLDFSLNIFLDLSMLDQFVKLVSYDQR